MQEKTDQGNADQGQKNMRNEQRNADQDQKNMKEGEKTGQQVVYVEPTGEIVQAPTITRETTTTTTVPDEVVTTQEIQQMPSRYELIEKKGDKEIYIDHQTGRKLKVERK